MDFNYYANLISSSNVNVSNDDKLFMYGLYKLLTVGKCNISEPSKFNIVAHSKYQAWKTCDNIDKKVAIKAYIDCAKKYV